MTDKITTDAHADGPEMQIEATEEAVTESQRPVSLEGALGAAEEIDWQKLWLETQRRPWKTLAIVPSCASIQTLDIARVLAIIGRRHLGLRFVVVDATHLSLRRLEEMKSAITAHVESDQRVILALRPSTESPTSLALARSADTALLAVLLGETSRGVAERIVDDIGAEHFVGSFVLHGHRARRPPAP
jgi:hypothetical protein